MVFTSPIHEGITRMSMMSKGNGIGMCLCENLLSSFNLSFSVEPLDYRKAFFCLFLNYMKEIILEP